MGSRRTRQGRLLVGLLATTMALAACGGSDSSSDTSSSSSNSASKTLVVDAVFSLKSADPAHNYEPTGQIVARALYSTLVTFAGDDLTKVVPDLASSWTTSDDGKTYTFTMNPAAKFTDGTPVTSADVVFSLNRVANVKGNPSFLMDGLTVTAPDATTVVVESATVDSAVLGKLANPSLGILDRAKAKAAGATDAADAATT
ncbi:MAG: ABC transporter substrate-binding protein, partial [Nakamurella sp.]